MDKHKISIICLGMFLTFWLGCSMPEGLVPVSGVEGTLIFQGEWPDSVHGAAVIALERDVMSDWDHPEQYLISYSDPVVSEDTLMNYFIQLNPGIYCIVVVGLLEEVSYFISNIKSLQDTTSLPIMFPQNDPAANLRLVLVEEEDIRQEPEWEVVF